MDGGFDKQKLVEEFSNLLGQMEQAVRGGSNATPEAAWNDQRSGGGGAGGGGFSGRSPEEHFAKGTVDSFSGYEELNLPDGRVLRRYDSGSVRVENPKSGVIQEERADGSLIISMPNGRVIFQEYRGEPLLVYDTDRGGAPMLARVGSATLPGEPAARFVFHFQDQEGSHLVDLETLRYYRVRQPQ